MYIRGSFGGGDLPLLIFALVFIVMGVLLAYLTYWLARQSIKGRQSRNWSATSGTVQLSELETRVTRSRSGLITTLIAHVEYEYLVDGERHRSKTIQYGVSIVRNAAAQKLVAQYPVGDTVQVYYNPANPDDGVLVRESPTFTWVAAAVVGVIALVLLLSAVEMLALVLAH